MTPWEDAGQSRDVIGGDRIWRVLVFKSKFISQAQGAWLIPTTTTKHFRSSNAVATTARAYPPLGPACWVYAAEVVFEDIPGQHFWWILVRRGGGKAFRTYLKKETKEHTVHEDSLWHQYLDAVCFDLHYTYLSNRECDSSSSLNAHYHLYLY